MFSTYSWNKDKQDPKKLQSELRRAASKVQWTEDLKYYRFCKMRVIHDFVTMPFTFENTFIIDNQFLKSKKYDNIQCGQSMILAHSQGNTAFSLANVPNSTYYHSILLYWIILIINVFSFFLPFDSSKRFFWNFVSHRAFFVLSLSRKLSFTCG